MKRLICFAGALAAALTLTACGGASTCDAELDGIAARLYRQENGSASITTLTQTELDGCTVTEKYSVTGQDTGNAIVYTTLYHVVTYGPATDTQGDKLAAETAFVQAQTTAGSASVNEETLTLVWTYTADTPQSLAYEYSDGSFSFDLAALQSAAEVQP